MLFVRFANNGRKLVIIDDADKNMTIKAQNELANIMKTYQENISYCFTCNYSRGIIDKIQNRCTILKTSRVSENDFINY